MYNNRKEKLLMNYIYLFKRNKHTTYIGDDNMVVVELNKKTKILCRNCET
jgi:hypothetical protein